MPKLKTHKGASKRFKKTGTGKVVRHHAFARHILTSKVRSRKRKLKHAVCGRSLRSGQTEKDDSVLNGIARAKRRRTCRHRRFNHQ